MKYLPLSFWFYFKSVTSVTSIPLEVGVSDDTKTPMTTHHVHKTPLSPVQQALCGQSSSLTGYLRKCSNAAIGVNVTGMDLCGGQFSSGSSTFCLIKLQVITFKQKHQSRRRQIFMFLTYSFTPIITLVKIPNPKIKAQ